MILPIATCHLIQFGFGTSYFHIYCPFLLIYTFIYYYLFFVKLGHPWPLFCLFAVFSKTVGTICTTNKCENDQYGAGIRTHDIKNMSLLQ